MPQSSAALRARRAALAARRATSPQGSYQRLPGAAVWVEPLSSDTPAPPSRPAVPVRWAVRAHPLPGGEALAVRQTQSGQWQVLVRRGQARSWCPFREVFPDVQAMARWLGRGRSGQ